VDRFVVRPGGPLHGTVRAGGAKNSALKLMAACLLAEGRHVLAGVPRIVDVDIMSEVLAAIGAKVERLPGADGEPGDLVIVAGRPSMGKTTLAVNIAENAAIERKVPAAIFSMEMSAEALTLRMIASLGRVSQSHLRTGALSAEDWPRITSATEVLSQAPLYLDETPALTPTEIRARARRLKREKGLGLIVVDYLQLMQVPGTKENRATEISEISRSLKALAKELQLPVIALSQLNRSVEQRAEKKPVMSDLRESGAIEQDADLILLIYREEVYEPNTPRKGIADIIVAKQRNGPTGEVRLTFLGEYTRFENLVAESYGEGVFR